MTAKIARRCAVNESEAAKSTRGATRLLGKEDRLVSGFQHREVGSNAETGEENDLGSHT